jgi:hypothetical protein
MKKEVRKTGLTQNDRLLAALLRGERITRAQGMSRVRKTGLTQNDRLLAALLRGERITRAQGMSRLRILNLWQRVRELKALGHHIVCDKVRASRAKGAPIIGVYYMPERQPKTPAPQK